MPRFGSSACDRRFAPLLISALAVVLCLDQPSEAESLLQVDRWQPATSREEIKPGFGVDPTGGRGGRGALLITADTRPGLAGHWTQSVPVEGGQTYAFEVFRKCQRVAIPRRSVYARIMWLDEDRKVAVRDQPVVGPYHRKGSPDLSAGEYPMDRGVDSEGWVELSGRYRAPLAARYAQIELHLDWAEQAEVRFSDPRFEKCDPVAARKVRLAAIHHVPAGRGSALENCREFVPLIADAARQHADLVVLPETLTHTGRGVTYAEAAESIPGPSTDFFRELARRNGVHLVVGLLERDRSAVYNVAVLIDDQGTLVGKYRKVCLPRTEVEQGICPGDSFPVFETRLGRVGMMICYDGFYPEVARELTNNGAEVIAFPVAGCNPLLAAARACENHVFVVSSTYTASNRNWMITGVFGHQGEILAQAKDWGTVAVAEVDLGTPTVWAGIGDFRAQLHRHRPESAREQVERALELREAATRPAGRERTATAPETETPGAGQTLRIAPREPTATAQTFSLKDGFELELLASEPLVTDPVAMEYDEFGRAYVVEMGDYPYTDPQTDKPFTSKAGDAPLGRIRRLVDSDGDGRFDESTLFAEELSWPTGLAFWKGGVFVAATPDLWYLRDSDGDGHAEERRRVFTGFSKFNIQAVMNNLRWGLDHRIYGAGGTNGGLIEGELPATGQPISPLKMAANDFRFEPHTRRLELLSGGTRFGQTFDDWGNRFTCNIRNPIRHSVLEDRHLARNPHVPTVSVLQDVAESGDTIPVYRASQPEPWRVVNSGRLAVDPLSTAPRSESNAAGYMTSACGITIYRGDAYPAGYYGTVFLGEVAGNLLHRQRLEPVSLTFKSSRIDAGSEFLVSTDNWFRPVNLVNAPDGTLHLLDMYRETIEHPWSIPEDLKARLDLRSGTDRGRIYRVRPPGFRPQARPRLGDASVEELVANLRGLNSWRRDTAHRLLFERQDRMAIPLLRDLLRSRVPESSESPVPAEAIARLHALWSLEGLGALSRDDLITALADPEAGVREHAVGLSEVRLGEDPEMQRRVAELSADSSLRVRCRVVLVLGGLADGSGARAIASVVLQTPEEEWIRTAALSVDPRLAEILLAELLEGGLQVGSGAEAESRAGLAQTLRGLAMTLGARQVDAEIEASFRRVSQAGAGAGRNAAWLRRAFLVGMAEGLSRHRRSLREVVEQLAPDEWPWVAAILGETRQLVADQSVPAGDRVQALPLLEWGDRTALNGVVGPLLAPRESHEVQLAAVRVLARGGDRETPRQLLEAWPGLTPPIRQEVVHALLARGEWIPELLEAMERNVILVRDIPLARRTLLLKHSDANLRERAEKLFRRSPPTERSRVLESYQEVLKVRGDSTRGQEVYRRVCQGCHALGGEGQAVGPALELVRHRSERELLLHVLDPNREVQPAFQEYTALLRDGRTTSGMIVEETPTAITFRRAQGVLETVSRGEVEELVNTGKSLMPEGLESQITPGQMADLLARLREAK